MTLVNGSVCFLSATDFDHRDTEDALATQDPQVGVIG